MKLKLSKSFSRAGLLFGLALGVATAAHAAPLVSPNGSFSGSLAIGTVSTTYGGGGDWKLGTTTTSITVSDALRLISSDTDPYLGNANNLLASNGGVVNVGDEFTVSNSTYSLTNGSITPFTVKFDGLTFTYTTETVTSEVNGNIALYFLGTLTGDTNDHYQLGGSADFSVSFTEAHPDGAIGASYSIDTPPATASNVPEPATLATLGVGFVGLAGVRRLRRR